MVNKKGSVLAEASIVFPLILLSLMAVISIFIYFNEQVSEQVRVHQVLRREAGRICGNIKFEDGNDRGLPVYRKGDRLYCYGTAVMDGEWMIKSKSHRIYAEKYLIDETSIMRLADFAGAELDENE